MFRSSLPSEAIPRALSSLRLRPLLDTGDSREELTLKQAALEDLPMVSRNPISLIGLTPGVTGIQAATTKFNPETTNHYSANGRGGNANTFIVDGLDIDSDIGEGVNNLTPNIDSLAEVTVQTNTYNVDYGKSSSIETIMTTKSRNKPHITDLPAATTLTKDCRRAESMVRPSRHPSYRSTPPIYPSVLADQYPKQAVLFLRDPGAILSSSPNPTALLSGRRFGPK